jgi:hypothetical protein
MSKPYRRKWSTLPSTSNFFQNLGPYCPEMGKKSFLTRHDAKLARNQARGSDHGSGDCQVYRCSTCGYFHLGSNRLGMTREEHRQLHRDRQDGEHS